MAMSTIRSTSRNNSVSSVVRDRELHPLQLTDSPVHSLIHIVSHSPSVLLVSTATLETCYPH